MEINNDSVHACVSHGLSLVHGDADIDLNGCPDNAFDFAVVSFPDFGYCRTRN